jgi:hypothetical protein
VVNDAGHADRWSPSFHAQKTTALRIQDLRERRQASSPGESARGISLSAALCR